MTQQSILVIREDVPDYEGQIDVLALVRRAFIEMKAKKVYTHHGFPEKLEPAYEKWETENSTITFINDELLKHEYLLISGDDIVRTSNDFKSKIHVVPKEEELNKIQGIASQKQSFSERILSIQRLALLSYDYNQLVFNFYRESLLSNNEAIRNQVLNAIHYLWWSEFQPLLQLVEKQDSNEIIRRKATDFLSYFNKPNKGLFLENDNIPMWWAKCIQYDRELLMSQINANSEDKNPHIDEQYDDDEFIFFD